MARFNTWDGFMAAHSGLLNDIVAKTSAERSKGRVYPTRDVLAFTKTPLRDVKVVILGQDPYHQPGQAHGLAFSVPDGVAVPLSLRNIFRELNTDWYALVRQAVAAASSHANRNGDYIVSAGVAGLPQSPQSGDLTPWTRQGVLLLNSALTVRHDEPGSHLDIWQPFIDEVIRAVCDSADVAPHFVLWGAKAKTTLQRALDRNLYPLRVDDSCTQYQEADGVFAILNCGTRPIRRITATYSAHPSPLSADKGFFGSRPFSRANLALRLNNGEGCQVDWRLP